MSEHALVTGGSKRRPATQALDDDIWCALCYCMDCDEEFTTLHAKDKMGVIQRGNGFGFSLPTVDRIRAALLRIEPECPHLICGTKQDTWILPSATDCEDV